MIRVRLGIDTETDRDSYIYKRVDTTGTLLFELFREYYIDQRGDIITQMDKLYTFHHNIYKNNLDSLLLNNYKEIFKNRMVETGIMKAFKGRWGGKDYTSKAGVVQELGRLSYNNFISHLRKIVLNMDESSKLYPPRLLHGVNMVLFVVMIHLMEVIVVFINILLLPLTLQRVPSSIMLEWLSEHIDMIPLIENTPYECNILTKLFLNGIWVANVEKGQEIVRIIKIYKRTD